MAYADDLARLQKRRSMAQALILQGAQPQGMQAGRMFVGPTPLSSLASLASVIAGGVMDRRLEKKEGALKDDRRKHLSEVLRGMTQPGNMTGMPPVVTGIGDGMQPSGGPAPGPAQTNPMQLPANPAQGPSNPVQMPPMATPPFNPAAAPQNDAALQFLQSLPIEQQEALVGQQALARLFPKPEEDYTLSQGQKRFRGGKEIAGVAPEPEKPPAAILEYQEAVKGGFKGSFYDYQRALRSAGASRVNVGDRPPPGFRWKPDGSLEAVPGGPAAIAAEKEQQERQAEQEKAAARAQRATSTADSVIAEIDQALAQTSGWTSGALGSQMTRLPGSDARDLQNTLLAVKANIGFDKLQQMREMSPTGGALGQVAVQELQSLQSTIASLDQSQSPEQLRDNLNKVRKHYENWKQAVVAAQSQSNSGAEPEANSLDSAMQRYLSGTQ